MYEFGVDFIARCLAGEALAKAGEAALNLVAGDNIDITYNSSTGETVISNTMEVDDELSLSSENPVQNKVITDALRYKPDTYTGETKVANQKIVQLTRAQYDAIQNKDPNTYYMITDDVEPCVRTAYKDMTHDYMSRTENGDLLVTFAVPEDFTMLEARICYDVVWSCGSWDHATNSLTSVLSVTQRIQDPPRDGRKTYMGVLTDQYIGTAPNQTHVVVDTARLDGTNYITYDSSNNTVTIRITKPNYAYNYLTGDEVDNTNLTVHDYVVTEVGYVAFGSDNITITESDYTAGDGININPDGVISIDADYGASIEMTIDPNTYVITTVLKDQNGNILGQAQSIDLPLESVVVSGRYDTATKTIILTLEGGSTISIPVGDLVSGLESESNKVTSIGASSTNVEYPSAKAVYDAIQNINEVPDATPVVDTGKVLTVDGTGNAVWSTPSTGVTDYTLLNNKPSINNVELNGNKTAAQLGLVETSDLNAYLTTASAANTYQTKSGMANYLTTTDAATLYQPKGEDIVPDVTSADNGKVLKATYSGGVGTYAWETEAAERSITSIVWLSGRIQTPGGWATTSEPGQMSAEDTYQINYSDNTTSTFVVTNGHGVAGVYRTGDTAEYTTYTMQFTNMTTFEFRVMKPTNEVPSPVAADTGKVLTATGADTYAWAVVPTPSVDEVPDVTSTDDGKVLTASYSGGTGSYSWQPASGGGGGLQVETDGTNYWITVNGIRLYFADSAPTGTIPDGSMGIGW